MSNKNGKISINKISFWLLVVTAVLYLVAMILHLVGINATIVYALQGVATALAICIVAVLAYRYVDGKEVVWKVLYFITLLIVLVGIVIPMVF